MSPLSTTLDTYEVWFLTGSQDLYGEETLQQVAEQSQEIVRMLADSGLPVKVVWKPTLKDSASIRRMALEAKVPVIPVVMVDTDTAMPIGRSIPRVVRVGIVIGEPLDFSRYAGMENDRYILRSVTDEIMVALQRLGEQEYDDVYASSVKERAWRQS